MIARRCSDNSAIFSSTDIDVILLIAPPNLNEPVFWILSNFKYTFAPDRLLKYGECSKECGVRELDL